jgi:hypothetical protein
MITLCETGPTPRRFRAPITSLRLTSRIAAVERAEQSVPCAAGSGNGIGHFPGLCGSTWQAMTRLQPRCLR